jgi:hypothetical protein
MQDYEEEMVEPANRQCRHPYRSAKINSSHHLCPLARSVLGDDTSFNGGLIPRNVGWEKEAIVPAFAYMSSRHYFKHEKMRKLLVLSQKKRK